MPPIITLLTDFGGYDTYVGQMKGAILAVSPETQLVDLTHEISPGDIKSAASVWGDAVGVFPPGTIHVGVVDPGVGTARRAVAAEIGQWKFVCPDNGLLTYLLNRHRLHRAAELNCTRWWRPLVTPVFHGRDIFGPVAGHWAAGRDLAEFGTLLTDPLTTFEVPTPRIQTGRLEGIVQRRDRFGNLVTNLPAEFLVGPGNSWSVEIGSHVIEGVSRFYGERPAGALMALIGSHGRLEIAVNQGSAADRLGVDVGTKVVVRKM